MKWKNWFGPILIGLILGGMLYMTGIAPNFLYAITVKAANPVDEVLETVLISHTKWQGLQGQATFIWYGPSGDVQTYTNDFTFEQPNHAYVDVTDQTNHKNESIWISDGKLIYYVDKQKATYVSSAFPANLMDVSMLPMKLDDVQPGTVYMHPMALLIPAPIKEYIFPSWLAQGNKDVVITFQGEEEILERKVWIVSLQNLNGDISTAWIDQQLGIILKYQQTMNGKPFLEMSIDRLEINGVHDKTNFMPPDGYSSVENQDIGG